MKTCPDCGAEFSTSVEKKSRFCPDCGKQRIEKTWKRQMRVYGMLILGGMALILIDYMQFKGGDVAIQQASPLLLASLVLGGLGLMGGLFGFSLALFFSMWHKKRH